MDANRLRQLAGVQQLTEKYEDHNFEQLIDELWGQLQNMQHFIPQDRRQFRDQLNSENRETYIQIANNIIEAATKLRR